MSDVQATDRAALPAAGTLVGVEYPRGRFAAIDRWTPVVAFAAFGLVILSMPVWSGRSNSLVSWTLAVSIGLLFVGLAVLTGRHVFMGRHRQVEIDFSARTATFENFNISRAFTTGLDKQPCAVFRFEEILGTERYSNSLCIVTSAGRIGLSDSATNFDLLWSALVAIESGNPSAQIPYVYTKRLAWLMGLIAGVVGLALTFFIAWLLGWV